MEEKHCHLKIYKGLKPYYIVEDRWFQVAYMLAQL